MGIDLNLIPRHFESETSIFEFNRLTMDRNYSLFDLIRPHEHPLPLGMALTKYQDEGIETVEENPYGDRITWVPASIFRKIAKNMPETSEWNKAVIQFMASLDPSKMIVLWWH